MQNYFRVKKSGAILPFNEHLVGNIDVELVTEKEAFPEKFAPAAVVKKPSAVKIEVSEEVANPPADISPELVADASQAFGTSKANKASKSVGLKGE